MYNDKIINCNNKPFELLDCIYTGGNIYVYFGKFEDGTYFDHSDWYESASIVDADPSAPDPEFDFCGFNPDWLDAHYLGSSDLRFPIKIFKSCKKHLSKNEAEARISEQQDYIKFDKITKQITRLVKAAARDLKNDHKRSKQADNDNVFPECKIDNVVQLMLEAYELGVQNRDSIVN